MSNNNVTGVGTNKLTARFYLFLRTILFPGRVNMGFHLRLDFPADADFKRTR
jgi:hypothetical protein